MRETGIVDNMSTKEESMDTKNSLKAFVQVFLSTGLLTACKGSHNSIIIPPAAPEAVLLSTGGTGSAGSGGSGGYVYIESYGSVTVSKAGTVDASFDTLISAPVLSFGTNSFVVSAGTTTVPLISDPTSTVSGLYAKPADHNLYIGDGDGDTTNDLPVTGLTIAAGATLVLVDQGYWEGYGTVWLSNDLLVNGTITSDASSVYIEANVIDVESGGKIATSAATQDTNAGQIYLGDGNNITKTIINRGTIEAKGLGTGSGGYTYFEVDDLVVNYGAIDTSGGSSDTGAGGSAGEFYVYVDYGDFYSSGTVRADGGDGGSGSGGDGGYVWIETVDYDNTGGKNGDILLSGTWESNGGNGTNGNGGNGNYLGFETDAMGTVTVNASLSVKGGTGTGSGGSVYGGIDFYSYSYDSLDPVTPGKIRIAGQYDLRGGLGQDGGNGGYFRVYSDGTNASSIGSDVELVNFPAMNMNGGDGGPTGGNASSQAFEMYTYSSDNPSNLITNEANIDAMGGRARDAGGTGGAGGNIITSPYTTPTVNTGTLSVDGGSGTNSGTAGTITIN
jgi:hypothetical protein